jgi:phytoene dehydrogenase-like protein
MASGLKACVIGSGSNGLSAAIVLAQAGLQVEVFEAEDIPGGATRSLELTLPGFIHDFGSAVYPLGAGSPFFSSLPLHHYGLEWVCSPTPLAHPLDDGTAVTLEQDIETAEAALGADGRLWRNLIGPLVEHWSEFAPEVLGPVLRIPRHPWLLAGFGMNAVLPAKVVASRFKSDRTRALFAGLAGHSFLAMDEPLTTAFAMLMAAPAHVAGWPIARGGSQSITNALCRYLAKLAGKVKTSARVRSLDAVSGYDLVLCDLTPKQLLAIAGHQLSEPYKRQLSKYRYGPAASKVDYALSAPIPWKAPECSRAATLHLGGSFDEIAASEKAVRNGQHPERPFVLLAQPTLFDPSRAPAGKHTAWAYCHVPHGSTFDMLPRLENQIERFAPGFRDIVLARRVLSPASLEGMDSNLVGGDIAGGAIDLSQLLFRPTRKLYATSARNIFLCSSSTPPGAGVHGMCGYHAARQALSHLRLHESGIVPKLKEPY